MSRAPALPCLALLAATLVACGSAPPPRPVAAVSAPQDALRFGMQLHRDDEYRAAGEMFDKALELYRSVDDRPGQLTALIDLADVSLVLGEHAGAQAHIAEARRLLAREPRAEWVARLDLLEAQADAQAGRPQEARALLDGLLSSADASVREAALLERARVALDLNEDAPAWLAKAQAAANASPRAQARWLRLSAEAARRKGDAAGAATQLAQSLELYRGQTYRPGIAAANEELGALAMGGKDLDEAADRYGRALDVRLWLRDRVHGVADLEALRSIEKTRGDGKRAEKFSALAAQLRVADAGQWPALQAAYREAR